MAKTKNKIPEGKLLKALAELEDSVEKGDALEDADPEGGFSTEGTPLSDAAPSGRGETRKAHADDDDESDDESSDTSKAFSASDMMSSKEAPKKKKSKKTEKAFPPPKAKAKAKDDDSSSDASSDDDDNGDDDSSTEKSFRETVDQDETISKAIEVSDFLEALVDQVSLTMLKVVDGFQKSIVSMESRLNARIDNRVAKGVSLQHDFNTRLAKAISAIGNDVQEQSDIVKSFSNQPAQPRGRAVLSKGEVNQPPWGGGQGGGSHMADGSADFGELANLDKDKVGDWLFAKSSRNQIDPRLILAWEANHYDVTTLPEEIKKSLANDLLK
jgi:hypothetical protein